MMNHREPKFRIFQVLEQPEKEVGDGNLLNGQTSIENNESRDITIEATDEMTTSWPHEHAQYFPRCEAHYVAAS